jgi:hypothetical protein
MESYPESSRELQKFLAQAGSGNIHAMCIVANSYLLASASTHFIMDRDRLLRTAIYWLETASSNGNLWSMTKLRELEPNHKMLLTWFENLALEGDFDAMCEFGHALNDKGDWIAAQEWWIIGAKARHKNCISALARLYSSNGFGEMSSDLMSYLLDKSKSFPSRKLVPKNEITPKVNSSSKPPERKSNPDQQNKSSREKPRLLLIRSPLEAEQACCQWLKYFGFVDSKLTKAGADGGVDIVSKEIVAQVKFKGVTTGRPEIQQLHGIAVHEGKRGFFFSLGGYTSSAIEFAEKCQMAIFEFDLQGEPKGVTKLAKSYMNSR